MKSILLLLLVLSSALAVQAAPTPEPTAAPDSTHKSAKEARRARRAARDRDAEVYKGQMAERVRFITDAVDAQKDPEPQDTQVERVSRKQARLNAARPAADGQVVASH